MSLAELKKKRNSVEQLQEKLQKLESKGSSQTADPRFWKPTRDANGNGSFLIRFLPAPVNENDSFVRIFNSSIQNFKSKKFLNELSLATIGQTDPVAEYFFKFKESKDPRAEWITRGLKFVSNILVIKDPANPDNEGKVFLYEYGQQIFNKIKNKMSPDDGFEDEAFDPFDPWEGANFKIKIVSKDMTIRGKDVKMPNYENSEFASQSKIGADDEIEEVYNREYSLLEFVDPKRFKSYDELKKAAERVLEIDSSATPQEDSEEEEEVRTVTKKAAPAVVEEEEEDPKPVKKAKPAPKAAVEEESSSSEEDFFNNLLG
jgi:hypothetical protein